MWVGDSTGSNGDKGDDFGNEATEYALLRVLVNSQRR